MADSAAVVALGILPERCIPPLGQSLIPYQSPVFTNRELKAIREIASLPSPFRVIVNSLCPTIYGNELVKAALMLSLFGGCQRNAQSKSKLAVRGDIHVLLVGA